MTSHPNDMDEDLIAAHRDLPALMPFLHLPVQTGSDALLAAMNRKHDRAAYRDIVRRLRAALPEIALSSDFIVGFPGESEADFAATLDFVAGDHLRQRLFLQIFAAPGTPGADLPDQVPEDVKARGWRSCRTCSTPSGRRSTPASLAKLLLFCSRKRGGVPVKSPAALPIYSLFRSRRPER